MARRRCLSDTVRGRIVQHVTCRFAFHHFEKPALAFAEMVRLVETGGRVVSADGLASEEPAKAEASTPWNAAASDHGKFGLCLSARSLEAAGLGDPQAQRFDVSYLASDLVARSFLANDRAGLLAMIESTVAGERWTSGRTGRRKASGSPSVGGGPQRG